MNPVHWQPAVLLRTCQDAELWNAILSYRDHPLTLDGSDAALTFSAIGRPDPAARALLIQPEEGPLLAAVIDRFPFAEMFDVDLTMADVNALPRALRDCLEEGIVSTVWRAIPDNRMGKARIIDSGEIETIASRVGSGPLQWLSISIIGVAPAPVTISVGLSATALLSVLADGGVAPAAVDRGLAQRLATDASYTLGSLTVTLAELAGLGPGDVVVLPDMPSDLALLRAHGRCHAFGFTNGQWVCLDRDVAERYRVAPGTSERAHAMSEDHESSESPAVDLDELGVVIDFDLGRMSLPLAQVLAWQPGAVVALEPPALDAGIEVSIRANGQIIGTGDLVRIDNRVGVRITRLLSGNHVATLRRAQPERQP